MATRRLLFRPVALPPPGLKRQALAQVSAADHLIGVADALACSWPTGGREAPDQRGPALPGQGNLPECLGRCPELAQAPARLRPVLALEGGADRTGIGGRAQRARAVPEYLLIAHTVSPESFAGKAVRPPGPHHLARA